MTTGRKRLSGEDARARILDAAVERLRETGPQSLTLATLAKELGISHQAILHHFGSREGLVGAVVSRALESLESELAGGLRVLDEPQRGSEVLLDRAFEVLVDQGHGRLLAWLALEGTVELPQHGRRPLEMLARITHAVRLRERPDADYRDTLFTMMLASYATLASSVFERSTLRAAGLPDDDATAAEFRRWIGRVVISHLDSEAATTRTEE